MPVELSAEVSAALREAAVEHNISGGLPTLITVYLPFEGPAVLLEETPVRLETVLRRARAKGKGKGKGRSRSPRRYLAGCKLSFFVFAFFTCDFERVTRVLIFFSKTMFFY